MDKIKEPKKVNIVLTFDLDTEELSIHSGFMDRKKDFKDPIGYTVNMLEMAIEKWIKENIGFYCPNCDAEMEEDWLYCPACGYSMESKKIVEEKNE
jgi:hypothetical protein